jgi:DNA-binding winged helix-turn-helix (wHTH) protein
LIYRFGGFTLNHDLRQLVAGTDEVHLSPKAYELLTILLANRTRAVSKAELQQSLWPSTFVEETNLAGLVLEIRRALGDSAAEPIFIRTVYGFGYRFVGDVTGARAAGLPAIKLSLKWEAREMPLMNGVNVIGREPDAEIRIESPGVSRHHARIVVANGAATLEDLGSKNGTIVNGHPIARTLVPLSDGDVIRLGAISLTFQAAQPSSPTETVPA